MRKLLFVILLSALVGGPKVALAQDTKGIDLSVFANYWDVKDGDDNVWGPGIGLSIPIWQQQLKFDLRATWIEDAGEDNFGDVSLIPLDFGLSWHYNCNKPWDFYGMGGMEVVFTDFDQSGSVEGEISLDDNEIGGYVGGGVRYDFVDNFGVFTNVYYRFVELDVETDDVAGLSTSDTYKADGLNVDIGLAYTF